MGMVRSEQTPSALRANTEWSDQRSLPDGISTWENFHIYSAYTQGNFAVNFNLRKRTTK